MADEVRLPKYKENYTNKTLQKLQSEICRRLSCDFCPLSRFTSLKMYEDHLKSKKHLRKKFRNENRDRWWCEACNLSLPNYGEWVKHLIGKRHDRSMQAMAIQEYPVGHVITAQEITMLEKSYFPEEDEDWE